MSKKLFLTISRTKINNDDLLLTFSEIKNSKSITYSELIHYSLNLMFKNDKNLDEQIIRLNDIFVNNKYCLKLIYLNKFSKMINRNIEEHDTIRNACIVAKFDSEIDDININIISFFVDIKVMQKDEFQFILKRIEFDKNNICLDNSTKDSEIEIKFEDELTSIWSIDDLVKKCDKYFSDDDYNTNTDKLNLSKWHDVISILQKMYDGKQNFLDNYFLKFENQVYLCSKTNINNEKNLVLTENDDLINNPDIKDIDKENYELIEKIKNHIKTLEDENNQNLNNIKEYTKNKVVNENNKFEIEENIINKNKELNDIRNSIDDINSKIEDYNLRIKNLSTNKNIDSNVPILTQIDDYHNQIKKYKLEKDELEQKENEVKKSCQELKESLRNTVININEYDKKINECNEKTIKNNQKIKNLNNSLENLKDYKFFYLIKNIIFEEEDKFESIKQNINDISLNDNHNKISINRNDVANAKKVKRYHYAINQLNSGYYKNFNLFKSIKEPSNIISLQNEVSDNIKQKYKLNNKQLISVQKAINIDDIFYLQGPPGTGKTQTLCAIAESVIERGDNLLMCSSTHEAINNFLERLAKNNRNNPNILIFKYKFLSTKEGESTSNNNDFSEKDLYKNFKKCIYNNLIKNDESKKLLLEYIQKYGYKIPEIKKGNTFLSTLNKIDENFDFFQDNIESFNIKENDGEFLYPFDDCYEVIKHEDLKKIKPRLESYYDNNLKEKNIELYNQIIAFDNIVNKYINQNNIELIIDIPNIIKKLDNMLKDDGLSQKIQNIRDVYDSNKEDNLEDEFLNYIFNNNMINVIGITTSSRQSIQINNMTKNLFSDYNIETMLIDEISKSSTPEILAKAVLAKRIILSGDYRQLPPSAEFCSNTELEQLKQFIIKSSEDKFNNNTTFKTWKKYIENEDWEKLLKDDIVDLFKTSFFVTQVNKLKNNQISNNRAYEFLNESWRFSGKILDIVNSIYDDNEKLINVKEINNKYDLIINNKNLDSELVMVDTSIFDNEFFLKYHKSKPENNNNNNFTFDQNGKPFELQNSKDIKLNSDSLYNQYTAIVIVKIIEELFSNNLSKFNDSNRIGIITLTKTQKSLVKQYINIFIDKQYRQYIKVDTIDNFQGREEEIIIVDFIRGQNKILSQKLIHKNSRNLSFLEEVERINVAISRAKSKLILVGSFKGYLNNLNIKTYGKLFYKYYESTNESDHSYIMFGGK